ncbi:putative reverse transcriptase domain-containing protein, partial [Tanacetum coccineum]
METDLWNLSVKNNDIANYTQTFQELTMMCTKMVPEEEDRVEKFIGGLLDNIQGNVIAAEPTRLQDAVRIANNLMDQKLKGYAVRNAENKRRLDNNYGNNRTLPFCNKCKLHHVGPCTTRCGKCNKIGHELTMMCTKMVPEEEDRVEKFIGGLPDNIQGNVIAAEPTRLQDAVRIANNLMDQKLKGYAVRNAENKRRLDNNYGNNRGQQPPHKRHNTRGQNVARAYVAGNNEERKYEGTLPLCNKCKLHYVGPCTIRCGKCNKVRHLTRNCRVTNPTTPTQRGQIVNQRVVTCFKCGAQGHYRKDCPKIKNQNHGNKTSVPDARGIAYALGGGDVNPGSNTVTGTFLLNDHHAYMLFDSGADRSFVSNTFSALLDITPYALDVSYAIELADRRTSETNTVLMGCTLGLLGHPFNIDLMPI